MVISYAVETPLSSSRLHAGVSDTGRHQWRTSSRMFEKVRNGAYEIFRGPLEDD